MQETNNDSETNDTPYKQLFEATSLLFMLSLFVMVFFINDANYKATTISNNYEKLSQEYEDMKPYILLGNATDNIMSESATTLNITKKNMILDCDSKNAFNQSRFAVCVLRDRNDEGTKFVTMVLDFKKV